MLASLSPGARAQFVNALDSDTKVVLIHLGRTGQPVSKKALYRALVLSRFRGDKAVTILEALELIRWEESGPAKAYSLTDEGALAYATLVPDHATTELLMKEAT